MQPGQVDGGIVLLLFLQSVRRGRGFFQHVGVLGVVLVLVVPGVRVVSHNRFFFFSLVGVARRSRESFLLCGFFIDMDFFFLSCLSFFLSCLLFFFTFFGIIFGLVGPFGSLSLSLSLSFSRFSLMNESERERGLLVPSLQNKGRTLSRSFCLKNH